MSIGVVVGLGNPGARYEVTRHNAGYLTVERLRCRLTGDPWSPGFSGRTSRVSVGGGWVHLLQPTTYMNGSGLSVARWVAATGCPVEAVLVVHDDLDLPLGRVRLKRGGGHGGHNGLRSVMDALGGAQFCRLRVGIGRPPPEFPGDVASFVLEAFAPSERNELDSLFDRAVDAVIRVVEDGLEVAMNVVNQRG